MDNNAAVDLRDNKPFNANMLKYIAVVAMLIDHIGWAFFETNSVLGQLMHLIGRFTAPIMCYFIAEGYYHTRNVNKYLLRLGIFAIISHLPFSIDAVISSKPFWIQDGSFHINPQLFLPMTSVIFTLFLGLLALKIWKTTENKAGRVFAVIGICLLSVCGDWLFFAVLWILGFGIYHGNLKKQLIFYYIVACAEFLMILLMSGNTPLQYLMWQAGVFIAPLFLLLYNGKRGNGGRFSKWFFYIFYPAHLLIIGLLKWYVIK